MVATLRSYVSVAGHKQLVNIATSKLLGQKETRDPIC